MSEDQCNRLLKLLATPSAPFMIPKGPRGLLAVQYPTQGRRGRSAKLHNILSDISEPLVNILRSNGQQ